jgi:methionine salvage enolase-phosphatase E1
LKCHITWKNLDISEEHVASISRVKRNKKKQAAGNAACYLFPAGILVGLLFNHNDGGDMFLLLSGFFQITGRYSPEHGTLQKASTLNVTTLIKSW